MGKIPFTFARMQTGMQQNMLMVAKPEVVSTNNNPIEFTIPKMMFDECFFVSDNNTRLWTKFGKGIDVSMTQVSVENHFKLFNIFNEKNLHD